MTTSPDYLTATNAAYEVLSQYEYFTLPVFPRGIIRRYPNIRVLTYNEAESKYGLRLDILMERSKHGFTMIHGCKRIILFNEKKDSQIVRFTLAHELGHCVLGHVIDDEISDKEANCFARNILCPIPAIKELKMKTINDYIDIFAVSEPMASASIDFANYDFDLIDHDLYRKIQDLLMCYLADCTLNESHENQSDSPPVLSKGNHHAVPEGPDKGAQFIGGLSRYVTEDEKELLDDLKFGFSF